MTRLTAHLLNRNVDSQISNRKDSQESCVIPAWVVSDLELCLEACALANPFLDALCLLLWLLKGVLAMKYKSLIILVEPRNEQCHLWGCAKVEVTTGFTVSRCKTWVTEQPGNLYRHAAVECVSRDKQHLMPCAVCHVRSAQARINSCAGHPRYCSCGDYCNVSGVPMQATKAFL